MSVKYLLPCPCGRKVPIDVGQSGQTIQCQCGHRLEIPTMLEIRSLERIEQQTLARPDRTWGWRQRLVLIGSLVVLVSVLLAVGLYVNRPRPPQSLSSLDPEAIPEATGKLTLTQSFVVWDRLRKGLPTGPQSAKQKYEKALAGYHRWMAVVAVFGLLGVLCAAGSLLVSQPGRGP